ncbi:MAG: glycosyltransferase family 2 protein [Pseudarcicella sp.]|nr:glycosyltransferase family 2 protein [Pseudarcicella sp.]MBP6411194.1 glycosyltransferase family 2 protein [Pseudarcicella sp.]
MISVLMPAYNAAKHLKPAIESIINQSFKDFELLVLNDGSTDATKAIILDYQAKDSRVKYLENPTNLGLTAGRNILYQNAQFDIIAWLDSDDLAHPQRLEKQLDFLSKNKQYAGVSCWANIIDKDGNEPPKQHYTRIKNEYLAAVSLFVNYFVISGMTMYKNSIVDKKFDVTFTPAEDYDMFVKIQEKQALAILPEALVYYRVHSDNLTATQSDKMKNAVLGIQKRQLEKLGFEVNTTLQNIHYAIAFGEKQPLNSIEKHLLAIKEKNLQKNIYQQKSLNFVLCHRWIKSCEKIGGFNTLVKCITSPLYQVNLHSLFLTIKVLLK